MAEEIEKIGFGFYDDTSDDLQTKSGGKFGLNQGAFLTKMVYNPKAGKTSDGADVEAIDINIMVGDREYMQRIFPTTKVFDKDNNEITDTSLPAYRKGYNEDWKQKNAVIVHVLKSVTTEEAIKTALTAAPLNTFKEFAEVVQGLVPADAKSKPLDVFLEYQWQPNDGQNRTFLQLPRNMKGGYWVLPLQQPKSGTWTEIRDDKGMHYEDAQGNKHPFSRDTNFMESPKANQIIEGEEQNNAALANAAGPGAGAAGGAAGTGGAKKSSW